MKKITDTISGAAVNARFAGLRAKKKMYSVISQNKCE